jgi:hypothetical protein
VSEQAPSPSTGGSPQERPEEEVTGFVQVTRRRAPRFRAFALTGVVVAFIVAGAFSLTSEPSDGYSQQALFGYLFCSLALLFVIVGAGIAVLVDRRTGTRPERRSGRPGRRRAGRRV